MISPTPLRESASVEESADCGRKAADSAKGRTLTQPVAHLTQFTLLIRLLSVSYRQMQRLKIRRSLHSVGVQVPLRAPYKHPFINSLGARFCCVPKVCPNSEGASRNTGQYHFVRSDVQAQRTAVATKLIGMVRRLFPFGEQEVSTGGGPWKSTRSASIWVRRFFILLV